MVLPLVAMPRHSVYATTSVQRELVTVQEGEIFEIRNTSNVRQNVTLTGSREVYFDFLMYGTAGGVARRNRGATLERITITGITPPSVIHNIQDIPRGGKMLIEVRGNGHVTVLGDSANFTVQQLQTPVFYVQILRENRSVSFTNFDPAEIGHSTIGWIPYGHPFGVHLFAQRPRNASFPAFSRHLEYRSADGQTLRESLPAQNRVNSGTSVRPTETLIITNQERNTRPAWSIRAMEVFGDYITFTKQPYRLTIDGERSFPPSRERELPPRQSETIITLSDIAGYSREARIMFNMIIRTNYSARPLAEYTRATNRIIGQRSNNNARMQDAYYRALIAFLNGYVNTHGEAIEEMGRETLRSVTSLTGQLVGKAFAGPAGSVAGSYVGGVLGEIIAGSPPTPTLNRALQEAYDDMYLLWLLYQNTNDQNLRDAIVRVRRHSAYQDAFTSITGELVRVLEKPSESALLSAASKATDPFFESLYGIYSLYKIAVSASRINSNAVDRVFALQGIRESALGAYASIINAGRQGNQFTEDDLLTAYQLYKLVRYCLSEQIGWSDIVRRAYLLNPNHRNADTRLIEEDRQLGFMGFSPMWYPYSFSSRLPNRNQETADRLARIDVE